MQNFHIALGQIHPLLAHAFLAFLILAGIIFLLGLIDAHEKDEKRWPWAAALLVPVVYIAALLFTHIPDEGRVDYVAADKSLTALNVARTIQSETETESGLLYYVSRSQTGETWTYSVIQMTEDDNGQEYAEIRTYPADKVRVYQNSSTEPRIVEHRSHVKFLNRLTFEWEYNYNELEYVELTVPEGSIVEGYSVDISESQNG